MKQARSRLDAERRVIRDSAGRFADVVEELADSGALEGLHGNARRGLARALRGSADAMADTVNKAIDRIEAAAARIEEATG